MGVLLLFGMIGTCFDSGSPPRRDSVPLTSTAPATAPVGAEWFYVHGNLNVRSGPGKDYPVQRTLRRGERVRLGPKDANGWAVLYSSYGSATEGYVYRASDLVRTAAPTARPAQVGGSSSGGRSSAESRGYYRGPRGGCYTYTASGRKRYVDRSLCN